MVEISADMDKACCYGMEGLGDVSFNAIFDFKTEQRLMMLCRER